MKKKQQKHDLSEIVQDPPEIVQLAIALPEDLRFRFRMICTKQQISMAEVVRSTIKRYVDRYEG